MFKLSDEFECCCTRSLCGIPHMNSCSNALRMHAQRIQNVLDRIMLLGVTHRNVNIAEQRVTRGNICKICQIGFTREDVKNENIRNCDQFRFSVLRNEFRMFCIASCCAEWRTDSSSISSSNNKLVRTFSKFPNSRAKIETREGANLQNDLLRKNLWITDSQCFGSQFVMRSDAQRYQQHRRAHQHRRALTNSWEHFKIRTSRAKI